MGKRHITGQNHRRVVCPDPGNPATDTTAQAADPVKNRKTNARRRRQTRQAAGTVFLFKHNRGFTGGKNGKKRNQPVNTRRVKQPDAVGRRPAAADKSGQNATFPQQTAEGERSFARFDCGNMPAAVSFGGKTSASDRPARLSVVLYIISAIRLYRRRAIL